MTHFAGQHGAMDITDCHDGVQLNICDASSVGWICATASCAPTDVYEAVAFDGDRLCCVIEYLRRTVHCHGAPRAVAFERA
jgi:hypothetical protein